MRVAPSSTVAVPNMLYGKREKAYQYEVSKLDPACRWHVTRFDTALARTQHLLV